MKGGPVIRPFWDWIPCTPVELQLMQLDPLIPWPNDQLGIDKISFPHVCHTRLTRVLERKGWAEARKLPEIMRLIRVLT